MEKTIVFRLNALVEATDVFKKRHIRNQCCTEHLSKMFCLRHITVYSLTLVDMAEKSRDRQQMLWQKDKTLLKNDCTDLPTSPLLLSTLVNNGLPDLNFQILLLAIE